MGLESAAVRALELELAEAGLGLVAALARAELGLAAVLAQAGLEPAAGLKHPVSG